MHFLWSLFGFLTVFKMLVACNQAQTVGGTKEIESAAARIQIQIWDCSICVGFIPDFIYTFIYIFVLG